MGYQETAYIESTGSQYIDTGLAPNPHYSIEVTFMVSQLTSNWDTIFGTRNGKYARFTARFKNYTSGSLGIHYSINSSTSYSEYTLSNKSAFADDFHVLKLSKNEVYLDGVLKKTFSAPSDSVSFPYNLYLFANNDAGRAGDYAYVRVAYCKIWNDTELVRDFIPVLDENDVACLYDKVSDGYFYNQGSGNFIVPADVGNPLVYNFDGKIHTDNGWVDTVSSKSMTIAKGSFVWEDSGLALTKSANYFNLPTDYGSYGTFEVLVKIDESFVPVSSTSWYNCSCIFGCELGGTQRDWAIIVDANGYFAIGHSYSTIESTDIRANDGEWHTLAMVVDSADMKLYIDGALKKTVTVTMSGSSISTFGVGWNKSVSGTSITGHIATLKVWKVSLTEDEVINSYRLSVDWLGGYITNGEAIYVIENVRYITSVVSSVIEWTEATPEGTSVRVFARLSDGEFAECENGEAIPGIDEGADLTNAVLEIKVELSRERPEVSPSLTDLTIGIQNEGDDHIIVLQMGTGNTTNIQNAIGEVTVTYAGGTLIGAGGMVPNFSMTFLPEDLIYEGHQHDVEHLDMSIDATFVPMRIYYKKPQCREHISVDVSATITLMHVDDL